MYKLGKVGTIKNGKYAGWEIEVQHDKEDTGGYFILISKDFNEKNSEAYDDWVETLPDLNEYFSESDWEIQW